MAHIEREEPSWPDMHVGSMHLHRNCKHRSGSLVPCPHRRCVRPTTIYERPNMHDSHSRVAHNSLDVRLCWTFFTQKSYTQRLSNPQTSRGKQAPIEQHRNGQVFAGRQGCAGPLGHDTVDVTSVVLEHSHLGRYYFTNSSPRQLKENTTPKYLLETSRKKLNLSSIKSYRHNCAPPPFLTMPCEWALLYPHFKLICCTCLSNPK